MLTEINVKKKILGYSLFESQCFEMGKNERERK